MHGYCRNGKRTPEYTCWMSMRSRCRNPNNSRYRWYGGRGIYVCERWGDFALFLSDMGPKPNSPP